MKNILSGSFALLLFFGACGSEAALSEDVKEVEIWAGFSLTDGLYELEVLVECDPSITGIDCVAPSLGSFTMLEDSAGFWEYNYDVLVSNELPDLDGDWTFTFNYGDGSSESTVIPFEQVGGEAIPAIDTCPQVIEPDLSGTLFATNAVVKWDSAFDSNANVAGIGYATQFGEDQDIAVDLTALEYDSVDFTVDIVELWIFNAFNESSVNTDGISYTVGRYASYFYEFTVIPAPEPAEPVTNHVFGVEIFAGISMDTDEYELEVEIECDGSVTGIVGVAPFGEFIVEKDYDGDWEFESSRPAGEPQPSIDGDWTFTFYYDDGSSNSTVIPFMQADGTTPLPAITSCPEIFAPDLSAGYLLETNVLVQWDAPFDSSATFAGIGYWNSLTDEDVDVEFTTESDLMLQEYGPILLEAGIEEIWIYNGFVVEGTNAAGLAYKVARFANYDYEVQVIRGDWDADADHLSNAWELKYFGDLTNGVASIDSDHDGVNNRDEFYAGTDPKSDASSYEMAVTMSAVPQGMELSWPTVSSDRSCSVFGSSNLTSGFMLLSTNLTADSYIDSAFSNGDSGFYRVQIRPDYLDESFAPLMNVEVDGNVDDWAGRVPHLVDPSGDGGVYSGLDITGVYFARGASDLFVRIDRAGLDMPGVGEYSSMWVFLNGIGNDKGYGINISGSDGQLTHTTVDQFVDDTGTNNVQLATDLPLHADGQSVELSIPLSNVDFAGQYRVNIFTHYSVDSVFPDNNGDQQDASGVVSVP